MLAATRDSPLARPAARASRPGRAHPRALGGVAARRSPRPEAPATTRRTSSSPPRPRPPPPLRPPRPRLRLRRLRRGPPRARGRGPRRASRRALASSAALTRSTPPFSPTPPRGVRRRGPPRRAPRPVRVQRPPRAAPALFLALLFDALEDDTLRVLLAAGAASVLAQLAFERAYPRRSSTPRRPPGGSRARPSSALCFWWRR